MIDFYAYNAVSGSLTAGATGFGTGTISLPPELFASGVDTITFMVSALDGFTGSSSVNVPRVEYSTDGGGSWHTFADFVTIQTSSPAPWGSRFSVGGAHFATTMQFRLHNIDSVTRTFTNLTLYFLLEFLVHLSVPFGVAVLFGEPTTPIVIRGRSFAQIIG